MVLCMLTWYGVVTKLVYSALADARLLHWLQLAAEAGAEALLYGMESGPDSRPARGPVASARYCDGGFEIQHTIIPSCQRMHTGFP